MLKSQVIIVIIAIIAVIFLFDLPKFIVKDTKGAEVIKESVSTSDSPEKNDESHNASISEKDQIKINNLRKEFFSVLDKEKKVSFADSLAELFKSLNKFDSSARYFEEIALINPVSANFIKAGDAYFEASTFSIDKNKAQNYSSKARNLFERAAEGDANNVEIKTRIAKTYLGTQDPSNTMKAVRMLKEVIEKDPSNQDALLTLGMLSLQSGQYEKAIDRFEALKKANPDNAEGEFYLGYSQMMAGKKENARKSFERVKEISKDENIIKAADQYLNELNK